MSATRKQHFVPRFYLRAFGVNDKQISIYNIAREQYIAKGTISGQCQRYNFYGEDSEVEDQLSDYETNVAPFIRDIISSELLPSYDITTGVDSAWLKLLTFVAIQWTRTRKAGALVNSRSDGLARSLMRKEGELTGNNILVEASRSKHFRFEYDYPTYISMSMVKEFVYGMHDLGIKLITSKYNDFITSDHPVFLYNIYCQQLAFMGNIGVIERGLVIFLPISPRHTLFIYDPKVYAVRSTGDIVRVTDRDIDIINGMQYMSALHNLYSNGEIEPSYFDWLHETYQDDRSEVAIVISEYQRVPEDGSLLPNDTIVMTRSQHPNLRLQFSFLKLRRHAARIPPAKRVNMFRHNYHDVAKSERKHGTALVETIEHDVEPRVPPPGSSSEDFTLVRETVIPITEW